MRISREELPDITVLSGHPVKGLFELLAGCVQAFDAHSRYLGRNPDAGDTLKARALLPKEALGSDSRMQTLHKELELKLSTHDLLLMPFSELQSMMPYPVSDKPDKTEALALAQVLEKLGVGLEPDIRFGAGKPQASEQIALFKMAEDAPAEPSPAYSTALSILQLAVMVSASDGHIAKEERSQFQRHVETMLGLSSAEKARLLACSRWLETQATQSTTGFKKRLESFSVAQRQELAGFLILIANADGRIDPAEIKILKKIYSLLGLDPEKVYSDIHSHQTADAGPVLVQPTQTVTGYAIPQPTAQEPDSGFKLNLDLVERKLQQTQEVQSILHAIFEDEPEQQDALPPSKPATPPGDQKHLLEGFDARHSALLRELLAQSSWERALFDRLCQPHGLMPEGALENINDICFQLYDDALLEADDETITLNPDLIKEFAL